MWQSSQRYPLPQEPERGILADTGYQIVMDGASYRERLSPHCRKEVLTATKTR